MNKYIHWLIALSLFVGIANAQSTKKITELTADTAPTSDDLVVTVNDPAGTPASRRATLANLMKWIISAPATGHTIINSTSTAGSGTYNTILGPSSGDSIVAGSFNTVLGPFSGRSFTTGGDDNVLVGLGVGANLTNGHRNVAMGNSALAAATGDGSAGSTDAADGNTAIGHGSMQATTVGYHNASFGALSLTNNTTGNTNTANGETSLYANTTGNGNVGIGFQAGYNGASSNATGSNNTYVGTGAAPGTATQLDNTTAIGYQARVTVSNQVVIGNSSVTKTVVNGDVEPLTDNTYYLGRNDDDSPQAWKGLILKDTNNGKYYRIQITAGVLTATDLTD